MLFVSFTKGCGGFPYVFLITCDILTLIPVDGITLGDHRVFVLRGDWEVLDGAATFEVSLDTIPSTDLFDTFTKTLCVRYDYMTLTLNFSGGSRGTVSTLVINPIKGLTGGLVEPFLHFVQSPLGILAFSESLPKMSRYIKESIFIRVNNPTLNNNIGKFNLCHIWDRVLINTPGLKLNN